ncbi:Uncharacterised protein [Clostridioides difficile]|nr:Uncharacterised protein [Clostridioides difficile]
MKAFPNSLKDVPTRCVDCFNSSILVLVVLVAPSSLIGLNKFEKKSFIPLNASFIGSRAFPSSAKLDFKLSKTGFKLSFVSKTFCFKFSKGVLIFSSNTVFKPPKASFILSKEPPKVSLRLEKACLNVSIAGFMPSNSLSFNSVALPPIKVTILLNTSVADVLSSPNFSLIFPIPSPIF